MKYDELLKIGNKEQLKQMVKYNHKTGYENIDIKFAYKMIKKNMRALWKEIYLKPFLFMISGMLVRNYTWHREIIKKAADIANYSHMLICKCNKELNI